MIVAANRRIIPMAVLRGGPSDGSRISSSEPNILYYCWLWLDDHTMKINCCGDYLRVDHEYSFIDGARHNHYRWAGWLWAPSNAKEAFPPHL